MNERTALSASAPSVSPVGNRIRVVLADDNQEVRKAVRWTLLTEPDMMVVGEASDGAQAIAVARELQPDVVLMDMSMGPMSGLDATEVIHRELPRVQVVGYSIHEVPDLIAAMRMAGAVAVVPKAGRASEMVAAIREAAARR